MRFLFFLIVFLFSACSGQENIPQISIPKHSIIGKWKSNDNEKNPPVILLDFRDNNSLIVEVTTSKNKIETKEYTYKVIDDSTVDFYYTKTPGNEKINATIKSNNSSQLNLQCYKTDRPNEKVIIDPPLLCFFHNFDKVSE